MVAEDDEVVAKQEGGKIHCEGDGANRSNDILRKPKLYDRPFDSASRSAFAVLGKAVHQAVAVSCSVSKVLGSSSPSVH